MGKLRRKKTYSLEGNISKPQGTDPKPKREGEAATIRQGLKEKKEKMQMKTASSQQKGFTRRNASGGT